MARPSVKPLLSVLDEAVDIPASEPQAYVLMTAEQYELLADGIVHDDLRERIAKQVAEMDSFYAQIG